MPHFYRIGLAITGITLSLGSAVGQADVVAVVSAHSAITSMSKSEVADIFLARPPDSLMAKRLRLSTKPNLRRCAMSST